MSAPTHSGVEEIRTIETVAALQPQLAVPHYNLANQIRRNQPPYVCELCNVKASSYKILAKHLEGRKHIMREQRQGKTFKCDLCQVIANSQNQLEVHLRSSRHKTRQARKERLEFLSMSYSKGTWIILFGILCIFINFLVLFKMIL